MKIYAKLVFFKSCYICFDSFKTHEQFQGNGWNIKLNKLLCLVITSVWSPTIKVFAGIFFTLKLLQPLSWQKPVLLLSAYAYQTSISHDNLWWLSKLDFRSKLSLFTKYCSSTETFIMMMNSTKHHSITELLICHNSLCIGFSFLF